MTTETIVRVRLAALAHARKHGFSYQECEDFAQEASFAIWENPKREIALLFIDYLRKEFGRLYEGEHNASGEFKTRTKLGYGDLDIAQTENEGAFAMNPNFDLDFGLYQDLLDVQERTIVTLIFKWDFTLNEVGECLGVSEGRVSQMLTEVKKKLPVKLKRLALSQGLAPEMFS